MKKSIFMALLIVFSTLTYATSEFDREITVLNQTRDEKVKKVFKEMMETYDDEDLTGFFSYVSEDRFIQDYMLFYDAVEQDMRVYDTLSIDNWVDAITEDGVKRFLYVRWEKRYLSTLGNDQDTEIIQRGYSQFLFDEVNGEYKLIELGGNNFWGQSSPEWKEEVPVIAGQEPEIEQTAQSEMLPDLVIQNITCPSGMGGAMPIDFDLVNIGNAATTAGSIQYSYSVSTYASSYVYNDDLASGESVTVHITGDCYGGEVAKIDPNNNIVESNENNNELTRP